MMKTFFSYLLRFSLLLFPCLAFWYGERGIDFYDYALAELGLGSWSLVTYISRSLFGLLIGLSLAHVLVSEPSKKMRNALTVVYVLAFVISALQYTLLDAARCYLCAAELVRVHPSQGMALWALGAVLSRVRIPANRLISKPIPRFVPIVAVLLGLAFPYILNYPPHWALYGSVAEKTVEKDLQLDSLVQSQPEIFSMRKADEILPGKKLVVIATLTCPFCIRAASKLHVIKKKNPEASCFLILSGQRSMLEAFENKTHCQNVPRLFTNAAWFQRITGGKVPKIYTVEGSRATTELSYWSIQNHHCNAR